VYLESRYDLIELVESDITRIEQGTRIDHIAIRVDNFEQEAARLQAQGVSFEVLPRLASVGEGKVAMFLDPDGNKIEILDREDLRKAD
jgi:catechol 2,3-dioxygenase-like lactoylglutathione lyase family enzyme